MLKLIFLAALIFPSLNSWAKAPDACSPINTCAIEKKSWEKNRWKSHYRHEISFDKFCGHDRPHLQAENELGLELWIFPGDLKSDSFKKEPYVTVNLHTFKLTHVVATASVPATASVANFTHRLEPRGNTVIEVTCEKKPTASPKETRADSASARRSDLTK